MSSRLLPAALVFAAVIGCATTPPPPPSPGVTTCLGVIDRAAQCSEAFVPMLVDVRVNHDQPAGTAEADATEGREVLVAKARDEWARDSVEPARSETCNAMGPKTSAEDVAAYTACLASPDCSAFVACVAPLFDKTVASGNH